MAPAQGVGVVADGEIILIARRKHHHACAAGRVQPKANQINAPHQRTPKRRKAINSARPREGRR